MSATRTEGLVDTKSSKLDLVPAKCTRRSTRAVTDREWLIEILECGGTCARISILVDADAANRLLAGEKSAMPAELLLLVVEPSAIHRSLYLCLASVVLSMSERHLRGARVQDNVKGSRRRADRDGAKVAAEGVSDKFARLLVCLPRVEAEVGQPAPRMSGLGLHTNGIATHWLEPDARLEDALPMPYLRSVASLLLRIQASRSVSFERR